MRVLVTEDDEVLAMAVAAGLRREGMAVDVALDGRAALERLAVNRYDVVVLDRDLPAVHGPAGDPDRPGKRLPHRRTLMPIPRPRPRAPGWPRLPRRTARMRLTALYGAAFLVCGAGSAAVLGLTFLLYFATAHAARLNEPQATSFAVLRAPIADVQRAGRYDLFKIPAAEVHQKGPYDVVKGPGQPVNLKVPGQQAQGTAAAGAQAKLTIAGLGAITISREQLLIASVISLLVIVVAAVAIGWLLAGRVLRPLRTITAAARRISASSLHERLALRGPDDELKELADTLDNLFARLEASFDAQRRFAANASHELRTPLTRERTLLQVTRADPGSTTGTWQAVSQELLASNAEQERLIEALLTLASSDAGPGEREPVDLAAIASAALAAARPGIGRLGLNVQADIQPAVLDGDPLLVQQLVTNLIDNAVRHNVPGGEIQVGTATSLTGAATLSVSSSGPVIPAAEVDRLFQPFQRLGPRPARRDGHGHGLGLSIVRAIAAAHGAAIGARAAPGGGLAVDVAFLPLPGPRPASGVQSGTRRNRTGRVLPSSLRLRRSSAAEPGDPGPG
jgi:signal transduction histidine kinase